MTEFCVIRSRFPDEPHRGPWTEQECLNWIKEAEDDGFAPGAFYIGYREVSPWRVHNTAPLGGRTEVLEDALSHLLNAVRAKAQPDLLWAAIHHAEKVLQPE